MLALVYDHDVRFADIILGSIDERLPSLGLNLVMQPKAIVQAFADFALAHVVAMHIRALEAPPPPPAPELEQ